MSDDLAPPPIPISKPWFGAAEEAAVRGPLETGWVIQGPKVEAFESAFAEWVGSPHAVACSSGTAALHLAMAALGVGPGDEVIVPAFTWVATPNAVVFQSGTPVFVDIDLATFNTTAEAIANAIGPRTVGILPVHLFGLMAEMDPILEVARQRGLWVVEDAACALGSLDLGRHAGRLGRLGCFSFHPRKSITTGEGGMLVTENGGLAAQLRSLRDHGASRGRPGDPVQGAMPTFDAVGFNYRLTDIQGALGLAQLDRARTIIVMRRAIAARYDTALTGLPWLVTPKVPNGLDHAYQSYVVRVVDDQLDVAARMRDELMAHLAAAGIATRPGTHAPVRLGYYRRRFDLTDAAFPNATTADRTSLALPIFPLLGEDDQRRVIDAIRAWEPIR